MEPPAEETLDEFRARMTKEGKVANPRVDRPAGNTLKGLGFSSEPEYIWIY